MINALSRLPPHTLVQLPPNSAAGAALRVLLTPGALPAPAGEQGFAAAWANAGEGKPAPAAPAAPARESAAPPGNLNGLAQLLRDIALITRAGAATEKGAANDALLPARFDTPGAAADTQALAPASAAAAEKAATASPAPQHFVWPAQAWPGQRAEFQITHWPHEHHGAHQPREEREEWRTRVRVELPRLGTLEAAVGLSAAGLRIAVKAQASSTLALLESGRGELHQVLADAGLNPVGLHLSRLTAD